jgi:Ca2+-binding RTX toxin-like protein
LAGCHCCFCPSPCPSPTPSPNPTPSPRVAEIIQEWRDKTGTPQHEVTDEEINDRVAQLSAELSTRQSSLNAFLTAAGLDLAAINLQRGRDLGLGTLNETRASLGLAPYTSFSQITSDATTAAALQSAYGDVNKVELWVGGLAEDHLSGAMVGQTFDVIISKQFTNLRDGDRLWYQNQGFDAATLRSIDSTTLSSVILNNTDIANMQSDAFVFYERRTGSSAAEDPTAPQLVVGANGGDTLTGGTRADLLVAGTGRQTLTGAAGADTFIVGTTGVKAVITDFKVGQDRLQFKNLGQPGKSGVKVTIEDGHVVITFAGNTVSLLGVAAKQFKLSDVSFT